MVWAVSAALVVGAAGVYDVVSGGSLRMVVLAVVLALFAGVLAFVFAEEHPDRWRWTRRAVLWTGSAALATDALVATFGSLGVLLGGVLAMTSPGLVRLAQAHLLTWTSRRIGGPPETLSRRDLLRRWEWTTVEVLRTGTSVSRRLALVEERRQLLDELQLRDPSRFDTWVASAVPDRRPDRRHPGLR